MKRLLEHYPKYWCPTLHGMLIIDGEVKNRKRTYRIYRMESPQVRTEKRKKLTRPRVPMLVPDAVNRRWSMDFAFDHLANDWRCRVLTIVDDLPREYVLTAVDFSLSGHRVARELDRIARELPKTIVCDNGPKFTSKVMYFSTKKAGVKLHSIEPGKPTQNAFVEGLNGKMRAYCLDLHWFASIDEARSAIDSWQRRHNNARPHRSLGWKPPNVLDFPHHAMLECRGTVTALLRP